jgi:toxin ParE1/3/4
VGQVRYTLLARQDLLGLWDYLVLKDPATADRIYDRIEERCRILRDYPRLGPARPEIAEGARVLVIERWLALYKLVENGVQVVRTVDGARDLGRLEWPSEG